MRDLRLAHSWLRYTRRRIYSVNARRRDPVVVNPDAAMVLQIRYSAFMPLTRAWEVSRQSPEQYRERLFDRRRLAERHQLFTTITLPSLMAQSLPLKAG